MVQQLKISEIADDKKMSKAIEENKLTVKIKRPLWEFNLYWKFMCRDRNDDKNKMNLPPPPFHSSYSVLNCWRITKPTTWKFSDFQFVFISCFVRKLSVIAWVDSKFVGGGYKKNLFLILWILIPSETKWSKIVP